MKFRRNIKEEKIFLWVAIGGIGLIIALLVAYFITRDEDLFDLIIPAIPIPPLFFYLSYTLKKSFVEFKDNQIVFVHFKQIHSLSTGSRVPYLPIGEGGNVYGRVHFGQNLL